MTTSAKPDRAKAATPFSREAAENAALWETFEDSIEKAFFAILVERYLLANGAPPKELRAAQAERTGKTLVAMHAAVTLRVRLQDRIEADAERENASAANQPIS